MQVCVYFVAGLNFACIILESAIIHTYNLNCTFLLEADTSGRSHQVGVALIWATESGFGSR